MIKPFQAACAYTHVLPHTQLDQKRTLQSGMAASGGKAEPLDAGSGLHRPKFVPGLSV